jgi:hypothetical protein
MGFLCFCFLAFDTNKFKMAHAETKSFTGALYWRAMDRRIAEWKLGIERIWSAAAPDYHEAACLADDIARFSE